MAENFNDVTDAFDGWLQTVTGTRSVGSYVDGRWEISASTPLSFSACVQNAAPDDLKVLEEGQRNEESIKLHTTFDLIPQIYDTNTGDVIFYGGKNWLVHNVAYRRIGGYSKAIAVRVD